MEGELSVVSQKARNRLVSLRDRQMNSIAAWDDPMLLDPNAVFVPVLDADEFLARMEHCIAVSRLDKLGHEFMDGGVLVRFRRKRDADVFREVWAI